MAYLQCGFASLCGAAPAKPCCGVRGPHGMWGRCLGGLGDLREALPQLPASCQGLRVAEVTAENFICTLKASWCLRWASAREKTCQKLSQKKEFFIERKKQRDESICPSHLPLPNEPACGHLWCSPKPLGNWSCQAAPAFLSSALGTPAPSLL